MSRREDDEIAAFLTASSEADVAADARHFTGAEVRRLRDAVEKASQALRQINPKGLPFAIRRDVESARAALEDAQRLVAKHHGHQSTSGSAAAG